MTTPLKTLYFLDGEEITLVEIKLAGLPPETNKSKVYFWLIIDKSSERTGKLVFVSMKSETGKEVRHFTKGKLTFNAASGIFETAQKRHPLKNLPVSLLPEKTKEIIQDYFTG
jgi:hypothetical protein